MSQKSVWVGAPSPGRSERLSSSQRWVITKLRAQGGISGGAGAHRPRAGGCARSRFCRRSGKNRSCSHSAHSYTAARAGSALCTRLCLDVWGGDRCGLSDGARAVLLIPQTPVPTADRSPWRLPTQRAREASSWKPPGHSHTAPPGRGTQRPLTQRHSSESSSELSSSEPPGRTQTSSLPPAMAALHSVPSHYTHLWGASPAAGGLSPRRNCSHSVTSGTGTLGGASQ